MVGFRSSCNFGIKNQRSVAGGSALEDGARLANTNASVARLPLFDVIRINKLRCLT